MDSYLKSLPDEELVTLFKDGTEKAFDELYERYASKLKRLIYYYISDSDESNDVLHDVFLRVYMHIESFKTEMVFSSWIYRIAVNCSKNYRRQYKKATLIYETELMNIEHTINNISPEDIVLNKEDIKSFQEAVNSLKEKFRIVFMLRYDQGLHYSQISGILRCPERTAKWRMQKAVEKIIDYLKEKKVV